MNPISGKTEKMAKPGNSFSKRALSVEELQTQRHEVVFAIKPKNLSWLEQTLAEVSDPSHEKYGQYLSRDEIASSMRNDEGIQAVRNYLQEIGAFVTKESAYGEFISAVAPLSVWSNHFQVSFLELQHPKHGVLFRSENKKIISPKIEAHLVDVLNINDLPVEVYGKPTLNPVDDPTNPLSAEQPAFFVTGTMDPSTLFKYYQIVANLGTDATTQAAIITDDETLSLADLATFQTNFKLPKQSLSKSIGGGVMTGPCSATDDWFNSVDCSEPNLDFQYMMGIGQKIPTISVNFPFNGWLPIIQNFTSWKSPPKVISISYGSYETEMSPGYIQLWNTAAMQLGAMGTTVVAASGDWGVVGPIGMMYGICQYSTFFPASSPYVLSVGGTMGPESGKPEVTSSGGTGGIITSGGGFAFYSSIPDYQKSVVNSYLSQTSKSLMVGYNPLGRGYPDVALAANNYLTVIGGRQVSLSGTSASAPVMAGMIALINAQRALQKLPSMGFINPYFYQNAGKIMRDVTVGNNSCTIYGNLCCPQGFPAAKGWDPTTGLGSINFTSFYYLTVPQPKTKEAYISDPSGEAAGTFFFVLAFVILAALFGYSQVIRRDHHGRKESFVPLPERVDVEEGDDPQL